MMVYSHAPKKGPAADNATDGKREFTQAPVMSEKMGGWRARRKTLALLERAMRNGNNGKDYFGEAISLFATLEAKQKIKTIHKLEKHLVRAAYDEGHGTVICPFDVPQKARTIHVVADFISKVAKYLPKDEEGRVVQEPFNNIAMKLEEIVEHGGDPDHNEAKYPYVLCKCMEALSELDQVYVEFWEGQLSNHLVQDTAIKLLLEHEEPVKTFEEHGWWLLRKKLKDISTAIGRNFSPKKADFLRRMLNDEEHNVVCNAFKASAYLDDVPEDFIEKAKQTVEDCIYVPLDKLASLREMLSDDDLEVVCKALEDAASLKIVPENFAEKLRESENKIVAPELLGRMDASMHMKIDRPEKTLSGVGYGIKELGNIELTKHLEKLEEAPSTTSMKTFSTAFTDEVRKSKGEEDDNVTKVLNRANALLKGACGESKLHKAAYEFLQVTELKKQLQKSDDSYIKAIGGIIRLHSSGAAHLEKMLEDACPKLARLAIEPNERKPQLQMSALNAIAYIDRLKEGNTAANIDPYVSAINRLLENPPVDEEKSGWSVLKEHLNDIGIVTAQNNLENSAAFLLHIINSNDTEKTRLAFKSALYLDPVPDEILGAAIARATDDVEYNPDISEEAVAAKEFLEVFELKRRVAEGDRRSAAADELVKRYNAGAGYLLPLLQETASRLLHNDEEEDVAAAILRALAMDEDLITATNAFILAAQSQPLHQEFAELARSMLEDGRKKGMWEGLDGFLQTTYVHVATGDSPDKAERIGKLLKHKDPKEVRRGFAAAVYLDDVPEDFIELAKDMAKDEGRKELCGAAEDFIKILELKEKAESVEAKDFVQATENLIKVYASGRFYLCLMLEDIAADMMDMAIALKESEERTENIEELEQAAFGVLMKLAAAGIQPPGHVVMVVGPESLGEGV